MRIGIGYDVHRLEKGELLVLGGVVIPFDKGLKGHSDADVLIHAIIDAILGSLNLGDVGILFPDTDERYRNISSMILLRRVMEILKEKKFRIVNIDSVIVAQKPKLKDYLPQMREKLSGALDINSELVSVKATTTEGLGFLGESLGISARAVVLMENEG